METVTDEFEDYKWGEGDESMTKQEKFLRYAFSYLILLSYEKTKKLFFLFFFVKAEICI